MPKSLSDQCFRVKTYLSKERLAFNHLPDTDVRMNQFMSLSTWLIFKKKKKKRFETMGLKLETTDIGYPLQYSCLENSMDRGAWWVTVHGVAKSWTRLSM